MPTANPTKMKRGVVRSALSTTYPRTIGTTTAAARAIPRPANSAPEGPVLVGRAMPGLMLPGTGFSQQAAQVRMLEPPGRLLEPVGGGGRHDDEECHQHHREDALVAEDHQPDRP